MLLKWLGYDESTWEPEEVLEYPSLTQGFVDAVTKVNERKWSKVTGGMPSRSRGRPKKVRPEESTAPKENHAQITVN